jgi:uncharacterized protein YutE (UPF0331/DUF86 family)
VTFLTERLADIRRHVTHLRELQPRVADASALRTDLSLHNDVLFSLLTVCQGVIDVAGELAGRRGLRFQDYTEAVKALAEIAEFPGQLVTRLDGLPGFRNVLIHEYVNLDYDRVIRAFDDLDAVDEFVRIAAKIEIDDE